MEQKAFFELIKKDEEERFDDHFSWSEPTSYYMRIFVKKKPKFNFAAAIFPLTWLAYRKMYLYATGLFIIMVSLLGFMNYVCEGFYYIKLGHTFGQYHTFYRHWVFPLPGFFSFPSFINLILHLLFGFFANPIYFYFLERKYKKDVKRLGVNPHAIGIMLLLFLLIMFIIPFFFRFFKVF